jgi:peptidoglycan/LPS O-acetylase OafA/YrhL
MRRSAAGLLGGVGALLVLSAVWTHWHEPTNAPNCGEGDVAPPRVFPNHLFEAEMLTVGAALLISGITLQARRRPWVAVLCFAVLAGLAYAYFAAATYGDSWPIFAVAMALAAVAMTAARRARRR